jgi:succinate-acetate transporter protein
MTMHDDRPPMAAGVVPQEYAGQPPTVPASGPGNAFPATAPGTPLSVFAFGFSVGILGLLYTGILSGRATGVFIAVAIGTGALGLLIGGLWDFRGGNLFAGTFGVAYALFLLTTGLILQFFANGVITAAGANAYGDAFAAWLILWAVFTAMMAIGAYTINMPAFIAFFLLAALYVILAIAGLGGTAGWVSSMTRVGGWVALADMVAAWYVGFGIVLNTTLGKELMPMFPHRPAAATG